MGSRKALAYLASPEVVAASAMKGFIAGTGNYTGSISVVSISSSPSPPPSSTKSSNAQEAETEILPSFPPQIEGEVTFCDADNINTNGIYPGEYTYQDSISREQIAQVCIKNYDSSFPPLSKKSEILVTGFNFGCGSSREQTATAILPRSIKLVVAWSFGNIFMKNSIINSLVTIELPNLIERLREMFPKMLTKRTG